VSLRQSPTEGLQHRARYFAAASSLIYLAQVANINDRDGLISTSPVHCQPVSLLLPRIRFPPRMPSQKAPGMVCVV